MKKFVTSKCQLCCNVISGGKSTATEEIIREVLNILLPKQSAQEKNVLVTCNGCSTKLFAAFNFKATCVDTEDRIFPYVQSACGTRIDLREVYLKERGKEHLRNMLEDERICRLCMQVVTCGFISIEDVDIDKLRRYIPEINISSTEQPVICKVCLDSFYTHTNFLNNFFNIKEQMNNICDDTIENLSIVKREDVSNSEEGYSDTTNNSMLKCKTGQHGPKDKYHRLKYKRSVEDKTNKCDAPNYKPDQKKNVMHQRRHKQMHQCSYKTSSKSNLTQHRLRHKGISGKRNAQHQFRGKQIYKCDLCDHKTHQKKYLKSHQLRHKIIPNEQKYKCHSCDFKTIHKNSLVMHQLRHRSIPEQQMYKCDACDYKSVYKNCLTRHRLKHKIILEEQMHKCDWCHYKTVKMKYFTCHQLKHKDVNKRRIYECDKCDFNTISRTYLTRHQLVTHIGVPENKKYKCDLCNYRTIYKTNLNKHLLKHKSDTEEETYKCDSCDFKSIYKYNLIRHQVLHKGVPRE